MPDVILACPVCDAEQPLWLGTLGNIAHLRCRQCGCTFNTPAENIGDPETYDDEHDED